MVLFIADAYRCITWSLIPLIVVGLIPSLIGIFAYALFATIYDSGGGSHSFPAEATHVPTFYVPRTERRLRLSHWDTPFS